MGSEEYGLEILKVREIIGHLKVTAVPGTPAYVRGVINLRGQVIPVVDLRGLHNEKEIQIAYDPSQIAGNSNCRQPARMIVADHNLAWRGVGVPAPLGLWGRFGA